MKRRVLILLVVCVAAALALPPAAQARGKGWKDLLVGMALGTALGATAGGASTLFLAPQTYQDYIFPVHYLAGAGMGLVIGTTGGALVGWLPAAETGDGENERNGQAAPQLLPTLAPTFEMPLFLIQAVPAGADRVRKAYFVYPVRVSF